MFTFGSRSGQSRILPRIFPYSMDIRSRHLDANGLALHHGYRIVKSTDMASVNHCDPIEKPKTSGTEKGPFLSTNNDPRTLRSTQHEPSAYNCPKGNGDDGSEEISVASENSDGSDSSEEDDDAVEESVLQEIVKLEDTFRGIGRHYRLIDRIGEGTVTSICAGLPLPADTPCHPLGTFSTVYKAEDLYYEHYDNEWDDEVREASKWSSPPVKNPKSSDLRPTSMSGDGQEQRGRRYVAIKKIYVTSGPARIQNELELLYDLKGCKSVCPLITAFRHHDQVIAVLPYFRHQDFRVGKHHYICMMHHSCIPGFLPPHECI